MMGEGGERRQKTSHRAFEAQEKSCQIGLNNSELSENQSVGLF